MLSIAVYCSGCGILWGGSMYLFSQVDDYAKAYLRYITNKLNRVLERATFVEVLENVRNFKEVILFK